MPEDCDLRSYRQRTSGSTQLHPALESGLERVEIFCFSDEGSPLIVTNWRFIMLQHGLSMIDEVREILLGSSNNESDEET